MHAGDSTSAAQPRDGAFLEVTTIAAAQKKERARRPALFETSEQQLD
jgi:hypothetical protein